MSDNIIPTTAAEDRIRTIFSIVIIVIFGGFVVFVLYGLAVLGRTGVFDRLMLDHLTAIVGIPLAALAALCIVFLLRATSGPIQFKALGFEFKGASGPLIMWVIIFLSMIYAIGRLWAVG